MKRILCIWLPDWPKQRRRLATANSPELPAGSNRDEVDVNGELARQMDRKALEALAACCDRFSPTVGLETSANPECLWLDITGLEHLFGGEPVLAKQVLAELSRRGLDVRIAIADAPGAAWAMAHACPGTASPSSRRPPILIVPTGETPAALYPLPMELLRLPAETIELLHTLGLERIGQLDSLPRGELPSRFGPLLLQRLDQAMGRVAEPVLPVSLPSRFQARWIFEHPTRCRDVLVSVLEHLIGRLADSLRRSGRGALQLGCLLDCPPEPAIRINVGLFEPMVVVKHLVELVQLQLEQVRVLHSITAIHVEVKLTAPLEYCQQALFEEDALRRRPGELAVLVDRLASRLGTLAVLRVRLKPDAQPELAWRYEPFVGNSRRRSRPSLKPQLPPRPLRLLPRPRRVNVLSLSPDGVPMQFPWENRKCLVARAWGPERIETGWWRGQIVRRDYFHVETTTGQRLWLYRRLRDGQWFLHGMFD